MHLAGQPLPLCAGQVDVIDGQRGGVQAALLFLWRSLHERWCYEAGAEGRWSKRLLYP
ncbi:hypothetical protein ACOZB2_31910 [Pantoea endophytica]